MAKSWLIHGQVAMWDGQKSLVDVGGSINGATPKIDGFC